MGTGKIITEDKQIEKILKSVKTVAVIGLSPKPEKESNEVGKFLRENGYDIVPIYPGQETILGQKAFESLDKATEELSEPVDVVDVFRKSDQIVPHAQEAIRHKPKYFWMQLGVENQEAAEMLTQAGIDVVMDRCMKREYERLVKGIIVSKTMA